MAASLDIEAEVSRGEGARGGRPWISRGATHNLQPRGIKAFKLSKASWFATKLTRASASLH